MDVTRGRVILPKNVKPLHYDLTLEPDFENFTYEGTVVIEYVYSIIGGNLKDTLLEPLPREFTADQVDSLASRSKKTQGPYP